MNLACFWKKLAQSRGNFYKFPLFWALFFLKFNDFSPFLIKNLNKKLAKWIWLALVGIFNQKLMHFTKKYSIFIALFSFKIHSQMSLTFFHFYQCFSYFSFFLQKSCSRAEQNFIKNYKFLYFAFSLKFIRKWARVFDIFIIFKEKSRKIGNF